MKIGITIADRFQQILKESSDLNNLSITAICGLIVENFLSYNCYKNRIPLFEKRIEMKFQPRTKEVVENKPFEDAQYKDTEGQNWEEMIEDLENFHPDSED